MKPFEQLLAACGIRSLFEVLSAITKGEEAVAELCVQRETDRANSPLQHLAMSFNRARERQMRYDEALKNNCLFVYHQSDLNVELGKIYDESTMMARLVKVIGYPSLGHADQFSPMRVPEATAYTTLRVIVDLSSVGGWGAINDYRENGSDQKHVLNTTRLEPCVIDATLLVRRPSGEIEEVPIPFKDPVIM